jgi:hypothetical protein
MSEKERAAALQLAKAKTVAEAWEWQKAMLANGEREAQNETSWTEGGVRPAVRKPSEPAR